MLYERGAEGREEGGAFNVGPHVGFHSTAASVKARSGLGGWTDGQGEQLLFFHHFKTERLECPFKKTLPVKTRPSFVL